MLGCCLLLACDARREAPCRFGTEHVLSHSAGDGYDELAVVHDAAGFLAFYSDPRGLFARSLEVSGKPVGPEVRLAERCAGGLDAITISEASGANIALACLRPMLADPDSASEAAAAVSVYTLQHAAITSTRSFGVAHRRSRGIALAAHAGKQYCVWQDAGIGEAQVWLAELGEGAPSLRVLSDPSARAATPSFAVRPDRLLALWVETSEAAKRETQILWSAVEAGTRAQRPRTLLQTKHDAPSPSLMASTGAAWTLAFRDRQRGGHKTGLYLAQLDDDGALLGPGLRVARADGAARPVIRACAHKLIAATPRSFAGDYFVGVVQVQGDRVSGEQQFYEDSHEFAQVATVCAGDDAMLLIAERSKPGQAGAALRSVPLVCE